MKISSNVNTRKYNSLIVGGLLGSMFLAGVINITMDPLWFFNHQNKFNAKQFAMDDRTNKTIKVVYDKKTYNAVLLGSSRSIYINQASFKNWSVFNYSLGNMASFEYKPYLEFYAKYKCVDCIIIGLDFFSSNKHHVYSDKEKFLREADERFLIATDSLSILKLYFACNRYVIRSLSSIYLYCTSYNFTQFYDRNNRFFVENATSEDSKNWLNSDVVNYTNAYKSYLYNTELKETFLSLKRRFPKAKFIVFTTPEVQPLFQSILKENCFSSYKKWIQDIVEVFGEVYDFSSPNPVNNNLDYFCGGSHFYPYVGTWIASKIEGSSDSMVPAGFGTLVNRENIAEYLDKLSRSVSIVDDLATI